MAHSIVEQVSDLVGETAAAVYWPKQHIYDAVNAALVLMWFDNRNDMAVGTMTATASTSLGAVPDTIMVPIKASTSQGELAITHEAELERYTQTWRKESPSELGNLVSVDWDSVRYYPPPSSTTPVYVRGLDWPPEVATGTETTGLDGLLDAAGASLAASMLVEDNHPDLAAVLYRTYQDTRREYMINWRNRGNSLQTLRPAGRGAKKLSGSLLY